MLPISDFPPYVFSNGKTLTKSIHSYLLVLQTTVNHHYRYGHSKTYRKENSLLAGQIYSVPGFRHQCTPEDLQALLEWMVVDLKERFTAWVAEMQAEGAAGSYLSHFDGDDGMGRWMELGSTSRTWGVYKGHMGPTENEFHALGAKLAKQALKAQRTEAELRLQELGL